MWDHFYNYKPQAFLFEVFLFLHKRFNLITMKYKAVIFDLDGTLVNSIKDIADAMNAVLIEKKYNTYSYEVYKTFVGSGLKKLVKRALPFDVSSEEEVNECLTQMLEVYSKNCINKTVPYEGVLDLLEELKKQDIKISILSNKEDSLTKKVAAALLPDIISPVLGLKEEALKKPNPKVALQISEEIGINPEETIYVGDSDVDMQLAKNARFLPVGVSWGFRSKEELIENGATTVLNIPADLLQLL
jgi:phosphoglycolate phosphatase